MSGSIIHIHENSPVLDVIVDEETGQREVSIDNHPLGAGFKHKDNKKNKKKS